MPQRSIYYAIGRLSVLEKNAIDAARLERLLTASDAQEARRVLSEYAWPDLGDDERNASEHLKKACTLLKTLSTDSTLTDAFLYQYDIANLKILLKARPLGMEAQSLSPCGTLSQEVLRHAVSEQKYDALPHPLKDALDALEKRLAVRFDPMDVDIALDKVHYEWVFQTLGKKHKTALKYFRLRVDSLNCLMALRAMHAQKPLSFFQSLILPGGSITKKAWEKAYVKPEELPLLLNGYGTRIYTAAIAAFQNESKLVQLEREADDALLRFFTPFSRSINNDERLIGYLLRRDREAAAVRLIMAGKENDFPADAIRERLRDLYA